MQLACQIIKMQMKQYSLASEKMEVIRQFDQMVRMNKHKLEAALETFVQNASSKEYASSCRSQKSLKVKLKTQEC